MSISDQHKNAYKEEAYELLAQLEIFLLDLEERPDDMEVVGCIFRALHTIKGSGSMFGFNEIAAFTHEIETAFDMVRNQEMPVSKGLIDLTLSARDHIKLMLDDPSSTDKKTAVELISCLKKLSPDSNKQKAIIGSPTAPEEKCEVSESLMTYRIRFRPSPDICIRGTNPLHLLRELNEMGECRTIAQRDKIPALDSSNPEYCYTYWDIILTTARGIDAVKDVFIFIEDDEIHINVIDEGIKADHQKDCENLEDKLVQKGFVSKEEFKKVGGTHKRLGDILVERGDISDEELKKILGTQKPIGELLVEAGLVNAAKIESALAEQNQVKKVRESLEKPETNSSIRVASDKLDRLVNLVGELVTVQARLSATSAKRIDPELLLISEEVERLTEELRDNTMSVRMLPIGTMFTKFKRLIRDLSGEMGKEVQMVTEGAETELDKTLIDRLNDPMIHLIRNSIDHGLELPEGRDAAGKLREGIVHLSARHSGANVLIEIRDDGAGLDFAAIRAKAIEKGLIDSNAELSEKEIFAQILAPGFSTAKKVTNVSGRGVGMDVVKRNIEALRGTIDIKSTRGAGTTVTLSLPLTLAIIDGLLVKISDGYFVLPLSVVEECVELTRDDVSNAHGRQIANVRGKIIPYIILREKFAINGDSPDIEQIVITEFEGQKVGFVVDEVIGEHQTVIKSLGRTYKNVEEVSGATILGDGTVALILDVSKLVQSAFKDEMAAAGNCITH